MFKTWKPSRKAIELAIETYLEDTIYFDDCAESRREIRKMRRALIIASKLDKVGEK